MHGTRTSSSGNGAAAPGGDPSALALAEAAAEALRRGGGALPLDDLRVRLDIEGATREPLARCLRSRTDVFLLLERASTPWHEQDWTPAERNEYESRIASKPSVVLVDGSPGGPGAQPTALLRESLLTMWSDRADDDQVRRELERSLAR